MSCLVSAKPSLNMEHWRSRLPLVIIAPRGSLVEPDVYCR